MEQINTPGGGNAPLPDANHHVVKRNGQTVTVQPAPAPVPKAWPEAA